MESKTIVKFISQLIMYSESSFKLELRQCIGRTGKKTFPLSLEFWIADQNPHKKLMKLFQELSQYFGMVHSDILKQNNSDKEVKTF